MNDGLVEKFKTRTFNQGSAILKVKLCNPKNLIFQHLPVEEREKKLEAIRKRNSYIIDALTSVDFQENIKFVGKVTQLNEGVIYQQNFRVSPFRKAIDKSFVVKQKQKYENSEVMQLLVKLLMNSLYGEEISRIFEENFAGKSEHWMMSENDRKRKDYWKISHFKYFVKMTNDAELEAKVKKLKTMPLQLGSFV